MKKWIAFLLFSLFFVMGIANEILFFEISPDGFSACGTVELPEKRHAKRLRFAHGETEFWQKLTIEMNRPPEISGKNDVLFYLHGMRGDREPYFSEVLRQMKSDYIDQPDCPIRTIVCLRWKPAKIGYGAISREAAPVLAERFGVVLKQIIDLQMQVGEPAGSQFHLLGNSMATRIFTLAALKMEQSDGDHPPFSSLIFAAPDFETARFSDTTLIEKFPKLACQTVFLFNKNDRALGYCEWKNRQPMLGKSGPEPAWQLPETLRFVEITGATNRTFAGKWTQHTYFSHSPTVVKKIGEVLCGNWPENCQLPDNQRIDR